MIYYYWCFLGRSYKYEPGLCDGCNDISMMAYESEKISILNINGAYYRCVTWGMSKTDANHGLNNSELDYRNSL